MARTRAWLGRRVGARPGLANRWLIAAAGAVMQLALGAVNAWSVFRDPLMSGFGWTISEVTTTYMLVILVFNCSSFLGGLWLPRVGPRTVGMVGGLLYGLGVGLAALADHGLWVLYLTYGLLGGVGMGLGFIVPIATLLKWFPDRRGFITGLVSAGYGVGALVAAPIAAQVIPVLGVLSTFAVFGAVFLVQVTGAALVMKDPPASFQPAGWEPSTAQVAQRSGRDYTLGGALRTWQWYALWGLTFLHGIAGRSLLSQLAPMAEELTAVSTLVAAGLVGLGALANGSGRFAWSWLSDFVGRKQAFVAMFVLQAGAVWLLPLSGSFTVFALLTCVVLLCYGGGFATIHAFVADYFGSRYVGAIIGLILTAGGLGGFLGPLLLASARETSGAYTDGLNLLATLTLAGALIPLLIRPPAERPSPAIGPEAAPTFAAEAARQ